MFHNGIHEKTSDDFPKDSVAMTQGAGLTDVCTGALGRKFGLAPNAQGGTTTKSSRRGNFIKINR
jgi:hypothetical protein